MNDLEIVARPYLETMLRGNRRRLYREGQSALAAWAVETALALDLVSSDDPPIAAQHYRAMTEAQEEQPEGTQVFVSVYRGWPHGFHCPHALRVTTANREQGGYAVTFTVHHAAFQVLFNDYGDTLILGKRSPWRERTPQI